MTAAQRAQRPGCSASLPTDSLRVQQRSQRSAVLAFKLAEVTLICDLLGQQPVLLLDDVMSELDEQRRRALVKFVSGDIQTFITTANLAYFDEDLLAAARVVRLPLEQKDGE